MKQNNKKIKVKEQLHSMNLRSFRLKNKRKKEIKEL